MILRVLDMSSAGCFQVPRDGELTLTGLQKHPESSRQGKCLEIGEIRSEICKALFINTLSYENMMK